MTVGTRRLARRTFLRGAAGVAVALPTLEIMLNDNGTAYADGAAFGCRYFLGFSGFSLAADAGPIAYRPNNLGPGYDLHPATAPLGDYSDVRPEVSIVSGLRIPDTSVDGGAVQPGGAFGFHWHPNPLLAGMRQVGGATNARVTGATTDQIVADQLGALTPVRNLNYRAQALFYIIAGGGIDVPDYRDTMSFRDDGQGNITSVVPTVSPRLAYESLFVGFDPSDEGRQALRKRQSVLDLVERRTGGVLASLGRADRLRMEQHLTHVRELEQRLEGAAPDPSCTPPQHPGDDPALGDSFNMPTCSGGTFDPNSGYSGEFERARLLSDFVHMAFACDLTRVATVMYSMWQCFMNAQSLGATTNFDVHATHHMTGSDNIVPIAAWHVDHFAYLVSKLRDTPEGAGSLLDNCALVFMNEGGAGVGPPGSESHTMDEMCWMFAGGAGGLRRGEHIVAPASTRHPMNVLITAMNAVGVDTQSVGEVSGQIPEMFA